MPERISTISLVRLAEIGELPDRQFIDAETLEWIKDNNPFPALFRDMPTAVAMNLGDIDLVRYSPAVTWFAVEDAAHSIHGVRHMCRVAVNSSLLASFLCLSEAVHESVLIAACVHDVRRISDKHDDNHGLRAANWLCENKQLIEEKMGKVLEEDIIHAAEAAIILHEKPYRSFSNEDNLMYSCHGQVIDLVKAADALDRYRLPKTKWWINDAHLQIAVSDEIKRFCFKLVTTSEQLYLQGTPPVEAVRVALEALAKEGTYA